jgi:hypothetical protein
VIEALPRIESTVRRTVAIRPVVVARREDGGRLERVEEAQRLLVKRIAADGRGHGARRPVARLEIAVVNGESEILCVHVGDEVRHANEGLLVRIGQVAPEADRVRLAFLVVVVLAGGSVARECGGRRERAERHA